VVGLLAGSGRFPILFAEAARRQGLRVACVGIRYEVSEELRALCDSFDVIGVSKLGGMIRTFRRRGVSRVVMAGKVTKNVMYTPWRFVQLWPDARMIHMWYRTCRADKRDDSILLAVIAEFERDGLSFRSALDYCPELLVNAGTLTRRRPTASELKDIDFGWAMAKEMGRLDVGQSVAVKERSAWPSRRSRGPTAASSAPGQLCRAGGWTLVKVAKPQQDMRFDVPDHRHHHHREPAPRRRPGPGHRGRARRSSSISTTWSPSPTATASRSSPCPTPPPKSRAESYPPGEALGVPAAG
jgi:DUF1009 family protein